MIFVSSITLFAITMLPDNIKIGTCFLRQVPISVTL